MGYHVFLSYSHQDGHLVETLADLIRVTGAPVFRDKDNIPPGAAWRPLIAEALAGADATIVFWSSYSANSTEVKAEYKSAISLKKTIVPVLLDSTPLPSDLSEFNALDLRPFLRTGEEKEIRKPKYARRNAAMPKPEILQATRELLDRLIHLSVENTVSGSRDISDPK